MDLFKNQLQGLKNKIQKEIDSLPSTDNLLWEEKPVGPEEFIKSDDFYGDGKRKEVWNCIVDDMNEIFSGENYESKYNILNIISAIGSGKSTEVALISAYSLYRLLCLADPCKFYGLMQSRIAMINLAPSASKAKDIVFDKVGKTISRVAWFRDHDCLPDPDIQSRLRFNKKNISIIPGNSSHSFPLGADIFLGIADEAAFFIQNNNYDPVESLFHELDQRRKSRFGDKGIIALVSSPNIETTFQEKLFNSDYPNMFKVRRARWESQPKHFYCGKTFEHEVVKERPDGSTERITLKVPIEFENDFKQNPRLALKQIASLPSLSVEPYFEDFEKLVAGINRDRLDPVPDLGPNVSESPVSVYRKLPEWFKGSKETEYICHVDLAKASGPTSSKCALALAHRGPDLERGGQKLSKVVFDLVTRFKAEKGKEVNFGEVRQFILDLKNNKGFNIKKVTFDQWSSDDSLQILKSMGFDTDKHGANYQTYETAKTLLYDGRVDFYHRANLMYELKRLEDLGNKVDHALGSSDDEAVCFVRCIEMIVEGVIKEADQPKKRVKKGALAQSIGSQKFSPIPSFKQKVPQELRDTFSRLLDT